MREALRRHVLDELVGAVAVREAGPPRGEMHFIDRHRLRHGLARGSCLHPRAIGPGVRGVCDDGRRRRRDLRVPRHRVGLQHPLAVAGEELELVGRAHPDSGDEQLPDAAAAHRAHRVRGAVPAVEVARHARGPGIRRPDREGRALRSVDLADVGAEDAPQLLVAAFADQMQIEFADRGTEAVRVHRGEVGGVVVGRDQLVQAALARPKPFPDPAAHVLQGHPGPVAEHRRDAVRKRAPSTDRPLGSALGIRAQMHPENGMRVVVGAGGDGVEQVIGGTRHRDSFTCRMWTGSVKASSLTKLWSDHVQCAPLSSSSTSNGSPGSTPQTRVSRWTIV